MSEKKSFQDAEGRFLYPLMRYFFPKQWGEWEQARYDYVGVISRSALSDKYTWEGAEFWGPRPGIRPYAVEVVVFRGKRYRLVD